MAVRIEITLLIVIDLPGNITEFYGEADGFIIGSSFKIDGLWSNTIDPARVTSFIQTIHSAADYFIDLPNG